MKQFSQKEALHLLQKIQNKLPLNKSADPVIAEINTLRNYIETHDIVSDADMEHYYMCGGR